MDWSSLEICKTQTIISIYVYKFKIGLCVLYIQLSCRKVLFLCCSYMSLLSIFSYIMPLNAHANYMHLVNIIYSLKFIWVFVQYLLLQCNYTLASDLKRFEQYLKPWIPKIKLSVIVEVYLKWSCITVIGMFIFPVCLKLALGETTLFWNLCFRTKPPSL